MECVKIEENRNYSGNGERMKNIDLTRALIEMLVSKSIDDIATDPHRSIRNLVEMGQIFSTGSSQRDFFNACSTMLENEDSAYYNMLENVVAFVDPKKIMTLGINVGYNGCTRGVKRLREYEENTGVRLPWLIYFDLDQKEDGLSEEHFEELVIEANALGVYTFIFRVGSGMIETIAPLIEKLSDSAFILLVNPEDLSGEDIHTVSGLDNILVSLGTEAEEQSDALFARCTKLHYHKCPYAVHLFYDSDSIPQVLNDTWVKSVEPTGTIFSFLFPRFSVTPNQIEQIRSYVLDIRAAQEYPFIMMEAETDIDVIDTVIATGPASVGLTADGFLFRNNDRKPAADVRTVSLQEALAEITKTSDTVSTEGEKE